jgi:hypothetical protein
MLTNVSEGITAPSPLNIPEDRHFQTHGSLRMEINMIFEFLTAVNMSMLVF